MVDGDKTVILLLLIISTMVGMAIIILGCGMEDLDMDIMTGETHGDGIVGDGTTIGLMEDITVMDLTHHGIMATDTVTIIGDITMDTTVIEIDMPIATLEEDYYTTTI
tara:strand:+ start:117 stop:440 length:324 start_codon:yes stop_codon:yes gene_type:complete